MRNFVPNILMISVFILSSCTQKIDYDLEEVYFKVEEDFLYYKGSPFTGVLVKKNDRGKVYFKTTFKYGKKVDRIYFYEYGVNGKVNRKITLKDGPYEKFLEYRQDSRITRFTLKRTKKDGLIEDFHWNGRLKKKTTYKNGKKDGPYESYHENGQLWIKTTLKGEFFNGPYESYHENGDLQVRGTFNDREWDGPYEEYYENGQLREKTTYKNGKLDGPYESYYENGQLELKTTYKNGRKVY